MLNLHLNAEIACLDMVLARTTEDGRARFSRTVLCALLRVL